MRQQAFDIDEVMERIRRAVRPLPKAAVYRLAEEGFDSPFEQRMAGILAAGTRGEVAVAAARWLFAVAGTPAQVVAMEPAVIEAHIRLCRNHRGKARRIHALARQWLSGQGDEPAPEWRVDPRVHRVCKRWGYVRTDTPEQTAAVLHAQLPERYREPLERLLVPFAQHICTERRPRCSGCLVREMCQQVGVVEPR